MVAFLAWGNVPHSFVVANGSLMDYQYMPPDYEGKFVTNEWNAMQLQSFHSGPNGYHWALKSISQEWTARCPQDMIPFLHTQPVTIASDGLARPGRGRVTFVAFAPNGISWFIRYNSKQCIWGPELASFPSTWQSLVRELEATHPRKDECIDFVAFGVHDLLLVRYENGRSQMILPEDPATRGQISAELIREVEERLEGGWTLGNRTTLCSFNTNRWFIEWRRGTSSEFRFSMGLEDTERADLERVRKVLSGVGSNAAQVADNQTAQLIAANSRFAQQYHLSRIL